MPQINKILHIDITVEQFLDACSGSELHEVDMLIQSRKYMDKMKEDGFAGNAQYKLLDEGLGGLKKPDN